MLKSQLKRLCRDEKGQDLIEYAMLTGFVAVAVAAFVPYGAGPALQGIYRAVVALLTQAGSTASVSGS